MALGKTTTNREGKENEYEEEVASLYEGMDLIVWFEASAPGGVTTVDPSHPSRYNAPTHLPNR